MELSEQIANILNQCCPAFWRDKQLGGATWQHCHCKAQEALSGCETSCRCVRHRTYLCGAGRWPQLAFLDAKYKIAREDACKWLIKAEQAIAKTKKANSLR